MDEHWDSCATAADETRDVAPGTAANERLQARALTIVARRRRRQKSFGAFADLFADPAWDALLLLFANHGREATKIGRVCEASGLPKSTALRLVGTLEERGLIERRNDPQDYRAKLLSLTSAGADLIARAIEIREP